jgi:enamine deaminase RidA (YjgF/YER057c/UK114 family)
LLGKYSADNGSIYYVLIESPSGEYSFQEQLDKLFEQYGKQCDEYGLSDDTTAYIKFYLSDIVNQAQLVKNHVSNRNIYHILLGMPPASGAKIAIEAYHIVGNIKREANLQRSVIRHGNYESVWLTVLPSHIVECADSSTQTENILETAATCVGPHLVKDSIQRTWFYIRDIDNNYFGFVDSRKQWFEKNGMTNETHFIASTGIEGITECPSHLVCLSAFAENNLHQRQAYYLSSVDHLSPTYKYNVTFERGVRLDYGELQQYYISGTASIDKDGQILHHGDLIKQAERIKTNMEALLCSGGATAEDLRIIIVYIRDSSDYRIAKKTIDRLFPTTPYLLLTGSVCRLGWLIEIEGVAIKKNLMSEYNDFF